MTPLEPMLPYSFRDPAGFVFEKEGILYRHVAAGYQAHYLRAEQSGLLKELMDAGFFIRHQEMPSPESFSPGAWKVIRPVRVPFISYAYEWCFGQLQQAALLVLDIQERALQKGMSLKDASSANVQFAGKNPVWIDSLSLEIYDENTPWIAYQQFCRHFLAPLALAAFRDTRFIRLAENFTDGIDLDFASKLLPFWTWGVPSMLFHIHGNARTPDLSRHFESSRETKPASNVGRSGLIRIVRHLKNTVKKLSPAFEKSSWENYHPQEHYGEQGFAAKEALVRRYLAELKPRTVWDLGANTGFFSQIASETAEFVLAADQDHASVQKMWKQSPAAAKSALLPLYLDLAQPTAGRGWENKERMPFVERGPAEAVLALGILHHWCLGSGISLERAAHFLSKIGQQLIVEFIPLTDPKAKPIVLRKQGIWWEDQYNQEQFEKCFGRYFRIAEKCAAGETGRVLYRMSRIQP